jgi:predicted DNA-binding antitoxin AbrB/MazE fold protein
MRLRIKGRKAEAALMGTTIKARFSGGVLEPLEKLELREGQEVTVTILSLPSKKDADWLTRTAGGWVGLIDAERLKQEINNSRLVTTRPEPRL